MFASQTPGLCSAIPSTPVKFVTRLCFALFNNLCFVCFASQTSGLCSAFPSAPVKILGNFCFPCFASQAPGLCNAIPSTSVKFVARLCFALLCCVLCLTKIAFVQGFSLRLSSCSHAMFCFVFSFSLCYVYFTSRSLVCECYSLGSSIQLRTGKKICRG